MSTWYSPTGFRRGIAIAAVAAALLIAWAIGYHQGVARRTMRLEPKAVDHGCDAVPAVRPRQS